MSATKATWEHSGKGSTTALFYRAICGLFLTLFLCSFLVVVVVLKTTKKTTMRATRAIRCWWMLQCTCWPQVPLNVFHSLLLMGRVFTPWKPGFWPLQTVAMCTMPPDVLAAASLFKKFYLGRQRALVCCVSCGCGSARQNLCFFDGFWWFLDCCWIVFYARLHP